MKIPNRIEISRSPVVLNAASAVRRMPRHAGRKRPASFSEAFESSLLFYDVFWSAEGQEILLVGPPPLNLKGALSQAKYVALPSAQVLRAKTYTSLSAAITRLSGAPADTNRIVIEIENRKYEAPVQPNFAEQLAGARILFTLNKNNELAWITEWAEWYVHHHRTDTILLFDNGSTRYSLEDVERALSAVLRLKRFAIIPLPHRYGPIDPAVKLNPYWPRFLQVGAMSLVLRRFAMRASGVINCDIDELANPPDDQSLYDVAERSRSGLIILDGRWIEPVELEGVARPARHRNYRFSRCDDKQPPSPPKWVLDPKRAWVSNLGVHPYMHWIHGRPPFSKVRQKEAMYWHFRGINTGWKDAGRPVPSMGAAALCRDGRLDTLMERLTNQ